MTNTEKEDIRSQLLEADDGDMLIVRGSVTSSAKAQPMKKVVPHGIAQRLSNDKGKLSLSTQISMPLVASKIKLSPRGKGVSLPPIPPHHPSLVNARGLRGTNTESEQGDQDNSSQSPSYAAIVARSASNKSLSTGVQSLRAMRQSFTSTEPASARANSSGNSTMNKKVSKQVPKAGNTYRYKVHIILLVNGFPIVIIMKYFRFVRSYQETIRELF
jgi:hypothetical protein